MKPLAAMFAATIGTWGVATLIAPTSINPAALAGVAGPLVAAVASWIVLSRTFRANPERLTGVMVTGFAIKAVFFAVYLVVMVRGLGLGSTVFVVSFVGSFMVLHVIEALSLRRLFAAANPAVSA
jgi:hypothetical protein